MTATLTVDDYTRIVNAIARRVQPRYAAHVTVDDLIQQLHAEALGDRQIRRKAAVNDTLGVRLMLHAAAVDYCETQKAVAVGYSRDDQAWYSAESVERLLPLACDPLFDGTAHFGDDNDAGGKKSKPSGDQANLLVQVIDIRRAIAAVGHGVDAIVRFLGGSAPGEFRRRALSNTAAVGVTRRQEES